MGTTPICSCKKTVIVPAKSNKESSLRSKRRSRQWRQTSVVHPAPPNLSGEQRSHSPSMTSNGPSSLFGSFRSRRSLRVFSKRTNTETTLNCIIEGREDIQRREISVDQTVLHNYTVKSVIGKGCFSTVLLVEEKVSHLKYALKVIKKKRSITTNIPWERELEVLRRIHHPNIIHLHEVHTTGAKVYLILELAVGGDLHTRLKAIGYFQESIAKRFLQMVANALEYLHRHGVTHRDLKMENCLFKRLDAESPILLSDFGLAHLQLDENNREGMQTTCGTPEYISPEMLDGEIYTDKIDMWAFGVVVYAVLSGEMPFKDDNRARMHRKIKDAVYSFNSEAWRNVSSDAEDFITGLLCVDPNERLNAEKALNHPWMKNDD